MDAKEINFDFLTWEIDTTGRYLLDEMCRMSACHQTSSFDEYTMPYRNITYASSLKIQLYTVSVGMYRSLRNTSSGMVMKTNTELVSLTNFMKWLSEFGNTPVILMCYEPYEYSPYILLQALKRYDLLDKFKSLVHGFADVYSYIRKKCKNSVSSMSLRILAKILLNKNNIKCLDSQHRANLVNEILIHLTEDSDNPGNSYYQELVYYISTVDEVNERLQTKLEKKSLQSTLKPIFLPYLQEYRNRRRALALRNVLTYKTTSSIDYFVLKEMWSKGPEDFKKEMFANISASHKDVKGLIAIISFHFENSRKPDLNAPPLSEIETNIKSLCLD